MLLKIDYQYIIIIALDLKFTHPQYHNGQNAQERASLPGEEWANIPDHQLWQQFQSGSHTAFATIYEQHASPLYHYGLKLVRNKELVMDTIQDLFIELWDSRKRLGNVQSIRLYLYKSIRRKIINTITKDRKNTSLSAIKEASNNIVISAEHSLIEKQKFDQQREVLKKALENLSKEQQEIIHLKYYGRLSYQEIAEIMKTDKKSAYNLMARAMKQLRSHVDFYTFIQVLLAII